MTSIEVKRLGLGPQPLDHRARLRKRIHGLAEVEIGQAVGVILAAGLGHTRARAGADAEIEPTAGHDVDGGRDLGKNRRRAEAVAGDEQAEAQAISLRRERRQQCPALKDRTTGISPDRHQVVKQPGVLDLGDTVGFVPDA